MTVTTHRPLVKLLTRPGCQPCEQAKFVIRKLRETLKVQFDAKSVNILKETQYSKYNDFLPVVLVDENPVCQIKVVERDLSEAITKAAS